MKFPGYYRDQNFCNYNMMPKDQDYVKNLYKKTISIIHIEKILFFSIKKKINSVSCTISTYRISNRAIHYLYSALYMNIILYYKNNYSLTCKLNL